MSTTVDFPKQRQVYLSKALKQSGDSKKRPVVVVSINPNHWQPRRSLKLK